MMIAISGYDKLKVEILEESVWKKVYDHPRYFSEDTITLTIRYILYFALLTMNEGTERFVPVWISSLGREI